MENNTKQIKKNVKPIKTKKPRRKMSKLNLWATIIAVIVCIGLIGVTIGLITVANMLRTKPELDVSKFTNSESSVIYDENGDMVAELGATIRENVSYNELPQILVDAFVAVEDSRFFEHNGFDVPRFTKALLSNIKTRSFSQGGSTFTMQLVKNTYFSNDEEGTTASRKGLSGVARKVQEIALAMELEKSNEINKRTILELYLNKINFGGNRNIRGVQKASEYYFGKDVSELNLAESAMLAGIINAPNAYNPFNNLELATERRNQVLYLMNYHGYISDDEYKLAKNIKVEDLLVDYSKNNSSGSGSPYQAYIDAVVSEVYELTGKDPYSQGMRIYTCMNKNVQLAMDSIQEERYEGIEFPDDEFELASIAINNATGEVVGILGGRNYASGGSLLLNHATEQKKQPGSAIKPILDYVLAFENLGWSTSHVMVDKPIVYDGTSIVIANANGQYRGEVTLKDALGNSLNTTAIQALQQVINTKGREYVVKYLNDMGIDISLEDFDVQCGIGGNKITVSCEQLAAAQGALLNLGQYTKPHTIKRIEFLDGTSPVTPTYQSKQTVSSEAAYMMDTLLQSNVSGGYANLMQILIDDYPVYAKTGTTDWGTSGHAYGIPTGAIKDAWMVASTSEYTVCTWIGYERAQKNKQSYITLNDYLSNIQGKTTNAIIDTTVKEYDKPKSLERPSGVVSISHILGTYPYAAPIDGMDEKYITSGLIKKEYASLVNPEEAKVEPMNGDPKVTYNNGKLEITWPKYPDESALTVASEDLDISLRRNDGSAIIEATGKRLFDYTWIYGPIQYKAEIKANGNSQTVTSDKETNSFDITANPGDTVTVCAYYGYEKLNVSSTQKCIDVKVEDKDVSLQIPSTTNADDIKNYLISMGVKEDNIDIKNETGTTESVSITDSNGKSYSQGVGVSVKQSYLASTKFTIKVVTKAETPIALAKSADGKQVNANVSVAKWEVKIKDSVVTEGSDTYTVSGNSITINSTDRPISVIATDGNGNEAKIELN